MPGEADLYHDIVAVEQEALAAHEAGQFLLAQRAHGRAITLAKALKRPRLTAALFSRLGETFEADGDIQHAVQAYEQGFARLAEGASPEVPLLQNILREFGLVGKGFDETDILAMPVPDLYHPSTAHNLETAEADPLLAVKLLVNIGNAYLRQPQEAPALSRYEQALRMPEILAAPELRAHVLMHIGFIRRRSGDIDAAEEYLEQALGLLKSHAPAVEQRRVLAVLAGVYRDRGLTDRALKTYQQALDLYEQVEDALGQGRTLSGVAALFLEQSKFAEALVHYQQAVELADKVNDSETLWQACWGLGCCAQANGDLASAEAAFRRSLSIVGERQSVLRTDEGKVTFLDSVQDIYDRLILVCLDAGKMEDAWRAAEAARGQAIGDLLAARRENQRPAASIRDSRRRPFADRQRMMVQMAPAMPLEDELWDGGDSVVQAAPGMPQAAVAMPVELAVGLPAEGAGSTLPAALPQLWRLVFHVLPDRTAIFVVTPGGQVSGSTSSLGRDALVERIKELRHALQVDVQLRGMSLAREGQVVDASASAGGPAGEPYALLENLYAQLVAPVEQALPQAGEPLVVEPHGALWLLPFAALRSAQGVWLADRWPILLAPSAEVLDGIRQEADYGNPGNLRALIVGNPTMPQVPDVNGEPVELSVLPGAEAEAKAVAAMFPAERSVLLLGSDATRSEVEQKMPQFGIVHLATHGLADADNPYESFVALGDLGAESGLLKAAQVARMRLPADLVCLSACQTGLGRISGEGMLGLSRAFLTAGARAVLVSLWSVNDAATAELIRVFYQGYLAVDDKALALQQAMRALRTQPEYEHPRYWAPFVLVGSEA